MTEPLVLINPFSMPAEMVAGFVAGWEDSVEPVVRAPGFRGGELHQAVDPECDFPVVNMARWDSVAAWQQAMAGATWSRGHTSAPDDDQARPPARPPVRPHPAFYTQVFTAPDPHAGTDTAEPFTLINPFAMPAELVEGFLAGWDRSVEPILKAPGFRGTVLHRARDTDAGLPLINVARWDSVQDWQTAMANSGWAPRPATAQTSPRHGTSREDTGEDTSTATIRPHPAFYTLAATAPNPHGDSRGTTEVDPRTA